MIPTLAIAAFAFVSGIVHFVSHAFIHAAYWSLTRTTYAYDVCPSCPFDVRMRLEDYLYNQKVYDQELAIENLPF